MQNESEGELKRHLWPLVKAWYEADEVGKKGLICKWLAGDEQTGYLIHEVMKCKFFAVADSLCRGDPDSENVFEETFEKFRRRCLEKGKGVYQGQAPFLAYFRTILETKCQDRFKVKKRPDLRLVIFGERRVDEVFPGASEDGRAILDTLPADATFTDTHGSLPSPEEAAIKSEEDKEAAEKVAKFLRSLSPTRRETLRERLDAWNQATGDIGAKELHRITKEKLGIDDGNLDGRMHKIREAYKGWFEKPRRRKKI